MFLIIFSDSKKLSEAQREALFKKTKGCEFIGWSVHLIEADELSKKMLRV
jgi:ribonuclease HII